jgi:hypothetical protein
MKGAMTELSAKIISNERMSRMKIIGPSQYLFLNRMNCQNSLKIEKREKKLISTPFLIRHSDPVKGGGRI